MFLLAARPASADEAAVVERVLAEPTKDEILEVLHALKPKDLRVRNFQRHHTQLLSNGNTLQVVSHSSESGIHFGVVILPKKTRVRDTPVMILAAGGDGTHAVLNVATDFAHRAVEFPGFLGETADANFVVMIPSFRGQSLVLGDKKFQSAGNARDAFEGAATDTISLLNVVLQEYEVASQSNIGIFGGSRGGAVALLVAARDARIKRAVVVAAPTDMKKLYQMYPQQFKMLFFDDLFAGKISERDARAKFIACSPIYFADRLPRLQIHQDRNDPFVAVEFANILLDRMVSIADQKPEAHFYDEGIHGFPSSPEFSERVQSFIRPLQSK